MFGVSAWWREPPVVSETYFRITSLSNLMMLIEKRRTNHLALNFPNGSTAVDRDWLLLIY